METTDKPNGANGVQVPVLKARVLDLHDKLMKGLGSDASTSNVIEPVNVNGEVSAFQQAGALEPPYDPSTLCLLFEHSNALRQNVDAYATNIDGFGHKFDPIIDLDADDAWDRVRLALLEERRRTYEAASQEAAASGAQPPALPGDMADEEVNARIESLREAMMREKQRLQSFFDSVGQTISFVTLRRRSRQDTEVLGNAYWEVLRNGEGCVTQIVLVPGFTMRLLPVDGKFVDVPTVIRLSDLAHEEMIVKRRFRRYVQQHEQQTVYFKEFGDPRIVSRKSGRIYANVEELRVAEPGEDPATEVLHFSIYSPRTPYGVPRWIGNLLAVLGSRQAEEVNYMYFENKSVPPLALLVSGGRVAESSIKRIEDFIQNEVRGKRNFHKILILEGESSSYGSGPGLEHSPSLKIELKPLTQAQQSDALFSSYDERNVDKIGQSFRLPRMLRGDVRDFNRATADAALTFAEAQVFAPERNEFDDVLNRRLLVDMGIRFWKFKSLSPVAKDPETITRMVAVLVDRHILTPEEGRELAEEIFNREFQKIDHPWVRQPMALTLAGIDTELEGTLDALGQLMPNAPGGEEAGGGTLNTGGRPGPAPLIPGARPDRPLLPGQEFSRERPPVTPLMNRAGDGPAVREVMRLIRLRDVFRKLSEDDTRASFARAKAAAEADSEDAA